MSAQPKVIYGAGKRRAKKKAGCRSRLTRRSQADIQVIREALYQAALTNRPATVRQVFYQLVSQGVIEKKESEYKGTVCRLLTAMRKSGDIPFRWIADNSRWMRKPDSHDNLQAALEDSIQYYRRNIWRDADAYVEIWLEKEALSGVLYPVTSRWDVPLMITRGYPSLSFVYEAAEAIRDVEKPTYLYYFGDRDPSGVDIPRHVEETIRELAPDADVSFELVAVTPEQIDALKLPTRPTKQTDSRARNFDGESVEVDAIPPKQLRQIVEDCITQHIDHDALERNEITEAAERESGTAYIERMAEILEGGDEEE
jgi:hypothetical protein